jgi:predicted DNA binding CopG/RHH family protein
MAKQDPEEKELIETFERGEWRSIDSLPQELERYSDFARATFKKDQRVNIRISRKDLESLQRRAAEEGIPYQTLMASVLHKYAAGRFVDKSA